MYFCGNYVYSNVSNWEDFNIFIVFDLFFTFFLPQKCFFWPPSRVNRVKCYNICKKNIFDTKKNIFLVTLHEHFCHLLEKVFLSIFDLKNALLVPISRKIGQISNLMSKLDSLTPKTLP